MDKYIKLEVLGRGTSGKVLLVKNLDDNKLYAIKKISIEKANKDKENYLNEVSILKNTNHQNIVKFQEAFVYKNNFCIVIEYADSGDLSKFIKKHKCENSRIKEDLIWDWFFQISSALKYLHSLHIIHRDIKPQNIFLTKSLQIKLGDFGISKVLENSMDFTKSTLGTPYFLSPEICEGKSYNSKTDIWMFGCLLYELCSLKKPFQGENIHVLINNIIYEKHGIIDNEYSNDLRKLIDLLLEKNPEKRKSIQELLELDFIVNKQKLLFERKSKRKVTAQETHSKIKKIKIPRSNNKLIIDIDDDTKDNIEYNQLNNFNESRILNYQYKNINSPIFNEVEKLISNLKVNSDSSKTVNDYKTTVKQNIPMDHKLYQEIRTPNCFKMKKIPEIISIPCFANGHIRNKSTSENARKKDIFDGRDIKRKISFTKNTPLNQAGFKSKIGQISINISSIQSPEHKAVYNIEEISIKKTNPSPKEIQQTENYIYTNFKEKFDNIPKTCQSKNQNKKLKFSELILHSGSISSNSPILMTDFIKNKIGIDNYSNLIENIDNAENYLDFINNPQKMEVFCGENHNQISNILKFMICSNKTPNSNSSTSTKSSFQVNCFNMNN